MTQTQFNRIQEAFSAYAAASAEKTQAEAVSASTGAAKDAAERYANTGVKADMTAMQAKATADWEAASATFAKAFQAACDATNKSGAAFEAYQQANRDSLQNPNAAGAA